MVMPGSSFDQFIALTTGVLLLSTVLLVWSRSIRQAIAILVVQGFALGGLVLTVGLDAEEATAPLVALLVVIVKAVAMPWAMSRTASVVREGHERGSRVGPAIQLLGAAGLTVLAYAVSEPIVGSAPDAAARAVPVGLSLVLLGFWQLLTRLSAFSQLVGFLVLDNGIATVAFLTSGGLPLVVELGVSLDVLLVVLILGVLLVRLQREQGNLDITELKELHD
jgi:hydrogenase-4 component E